jgi:hypothetical protein
MEKVRQVVERLAWAKPGIKKPVLDKYGFSLYKY